MITCLYLHKDWHRHGEEIDEMVADMLSAMDFDLQIYGGTELGGSM
jgi:hypothetical protein